MNTVRSKDGTPIAFDRLGEGPPVILVGGALNDRRSVMPLAELLAPHFTVFAYDRRGRGDSGDTRPYEVEREIEDLQSLITEAGGSACVFANCSGAILALEAAASGLAITKLALYEPSYVVDDTRPPIGKDYAERLAALVESGDLGGAVELFMREAADLPAEFVAKVRQGEAWPMLEALAPSLVYDAAVLGDSSLPTERVASVAVPTLVFDGDSSPEWGRNTVRAVVETLPNASHLTLEGQNHNLVAEAVAPALVRFLAG
ncbi:alpha/beta hydrolase [Thermobifida halotolerans]|uniref:Alpha/beta hydrolase n=1 Tax=Thermobifida halotolerans TaxID=483545 RepID=A0A399G6R7_9ACTN|nr:alpha/beta hydrolase [Thermobifida halotolerans]UOE21130.1 alpha/beta hydrolase [Thermobifida halotolerans]